jgi:hypothetical protein
VAKGSEGCRHGSIKISLELDQKILIVTPART